MAYDTWSARFLCAHVRQRESSKSRSIRDTELKIRTRDLNDDVVGLEILAHGQTDAEGRFDLGAVAMKSEVAFPLENGVLFEFGVRTNSEQRPVISVNFTAPRATDATVESVNAEISVH